MKPFSRYPISVAATLVVAVATLAHHTDGFTTYTYEGARRNSIERQAIGVGNWKLQNARGEPLALDTLDDQLLLVNFIYTRCPTICRAQGSRYQQLSRFIRDQQLSNVKLLSISIDPQYDTPQNLAAYKKAHARQTDSWMVTRPTSNDILQQLKRETGLQVIADPVWGFAHSDGIHIIRNRQLISILDPESTELEAILLQAGKS